MNNKRQEHSDFMINIPPTTAAVSASVKSCP